MNITYLYSNEFSFFSGAQEQLDQLIKQLQFEHHTESEHGDIEKFINKEGQEILRRLLQGWLDLKATNEEKKESIFSASEEKLNHVRVNTSRPLNYLLPAVLLKVHAVTLSMSDWILQARAGVYRG